MAGAGQGAQPRSDPTTTLGQLMVMMIMITINGTEGSLANIANNNFDALPI